MFSLSSPCLHGLFADVCGERLPVSIDISSKAIHVLHFQPLSLRVLCHGQE